MNHPLDPNITGMFVTEGWACGTLSRIRADREYYKTLNSKPKFMAESDGWVDGTLNVKTTDANICINDQRGENGQGTYKVINTKEPNLLEQIKKLVRENGNDDTLGGLVRKLLI